MLLLVAAIPAVTCTAASFHSVYLVKNCIMHNKVTQVLCSRVSDSCIVFTGSLTHRISVEDGYCKGLSKTHKFVQHISGATLG